MARGAVVGLANKECLVCAGALFMRRVKETGTTLLPVDSEHNAIFQALAAGRRSDVKRIVLTASRRPISDMATGPDAVKATIEQALTASQLVDGPQDHGRFSDHDEQGP